MALFGKQKSTHGVKVRRASGKNSGKGGRFGSLGQMNKLPNVKMKARG